MKIEDVLKAHGGRYGGGKKPLFTQYYNDLGLSLPIMDYQIPGKIGTETVNGVYGFGISENLDKLVVATSYPSRLLFADNKFNLIAKIDTTNLHTSINHLINDFVVMIDEKIPHTIKIYKGSSLQQSINTSDNGLLFSNNSDRFIILSGTKIMNYQIYGSSILKIREKSHSTYYATGCYIRNNKYVVANKDKISFISSDLDEIIIPLSTYGLIVGANHPTIDYNNKFNIITLAVNDKIAIIDANTRELISNFNTPPTSYINNMTAVYLDNNKNIHLLNGGEYSNACYSFAGNLIHKVDNIVSYMKYSNVKVKGFPVFSFTQGNQPFGAMFRTHL